jgi:hypothetical protein
VIGWAAKEEVSDVSLSMKIRTVETALKDAGTDNALNGVVDVLKEIARALDGLEKRTKKIEDKLAARERKESDARVAPNARRITTVQR